VEENTLNTQSVEFEYGNKTVKIETGKVARQATSSIIVTIDNLVVLTTMVARKEADPRKDFFPLAVFYQEKFYAAGKIPGGYFKREARPTEQETLTSRLIDRPIRPLFPEDFKNEVQIFCTVLSADKNINPDIASLIGASAALSISGVPFQGPLGAARVGFIDSNFVLNPSPSELEDSMLDMVVAGTEDAVLMVESEASELSEDIMLGSVLFGHQEMQKVIKACSDLRAKVNPTPWEFTEDTMTAEFTANIAESFTDEISTAFKIADKAERGDALHAIKDKISEKHGAELDDLEKGKLMNAFKAVEKDVVRKSILANEPRIDGRDRDTVRSIYVETGVLPSTHGSSLFTRGETQALVVATLGSTRDAQRIESLNGEQHNQFMLHYNFPAYSVGEIGMPLGPKRREIGHGNLAKRAIKAVLPNSEEFGYTLRVVSEITESNGSSSMASVCGTSLSLMDAGVPITNPVAGIAMGLIKEDDNFAVLTDILGDEDHLGDMDFKVAGSAAGITALQMDIKIQGITEEIMEMALEQAHEARIHILDEMNKVIAVPRTELNDNAPTMKTIKIDQDKIRDVIGKGGATIRGLCEETGASIDIEDDGTVRVYADDKAAAELAEAKILEITAEAEVGAIYEGKVERIVDFGAFINILPGKDGLLHISQISSERVEKVTDYLEEGQTVKVKVLDVDARGRIKLSMKDMEA
jgi:polyribonucleotide nucleotidyltransferase